MSTSKSMRKTGIIIVLTGDGKGKTTSALGMALRAVGHGMKVCIIYFIKGKSSGEMPALKKLNVEFHLMGKGFYNPKAHEKHRLSAQSAIKLAREKMLSENFDILILDEINNALQLGLVDLSQLLELINDKPPSMHLILTGRDAHPDVIKRAHTVTEMKEIRHAFDKGIKPEKGIDY
ncbi:MAG: cob(I)yrinic acid a,c-diamide adenosyltransferase [Nitrospirae bacterium]|nr:cob(I)yrinic acid a,c-diamide adenosyltransferase [Nitrospirota bacterium]